MKTKTVKEFLRDQDTTARALQKAMSFTLKDIRPCVAKVSPTLIDTMLKSVIREEDLDVTAMAQMDYLDLLCLIHNIKDNDNYRGAYCSDEDETPDTYSGYEEYLFHVDLLRGLLRILEKEILPVQILLKVPFKNLCHVLENRRNTGAVTACRVNLIRQFRDAGWLERVDGKETLGEILDICYGQLNKRWLPAVYTPEDFADRARGMLDFIGEILIEPFRIAYPERFHIEDVRAKFGIDCSKMSTEYLASERSLSGYEQYENSK